MLAPPLVGACLACAWPPPWWGVPFWCVAPLSLGRALLVAACRGGGVWFGLSSSVGWVVVAVVLLAWPGLVLCWCVPPPPCWGMSCLCVAPPLVGSAVSACSGFRSWCCSRLNARLVLLVRCCLRRRTADVAGCWLSVLFALPGLVLCWCVPPTPLVGRAALGCGPLPGGACCVGACPPSCWGVLCWCPPAAVVVFGLGCRRLFSGLWLWLCCWLGRGWCCAGACPPPPPRVGAWPPPWWGVLFQRVRFLVRGVVAGWMLGLFCWCAVVSAAVRPALSVVAHLWCSPGQDGQAGLPSACGAPPLCPGRVGRAGLPSACGAPLLVFVSRVSSPCCSWSFACSCLCGSWPCAGVCRRLLLCPPPHPALLLVVSRPPPLLLGVPRPPAVVPPPRGYALPGWLSPPPCLPLLPLCPPPPPGSCFPGVLAPAARFPLSPCFCLVFSVSLALALVWLGFFFPPRLALVPPPHPPPPPGGCSWWSAVPRVLFGGAAVRCGLLCEARGVLLRRAVLLCGCLAVWCARLLCRWPSPVGVGHALSVGVARCSALPCCFARRFVVCGAVVRCRVLRCFPCCSVVSWLFSLCLLGFAHLRVCAAWCCPPPPPWFVCRAFCRFVLPRCAGLFCPLWCRVVACCVVLFGVRRAVSCCAPRVAWCGAAVPRAAASCCVLCRARWCCAVLSCVAPFAGVLRPGALCCAVPLCAVVGCFVPSGVRWRCAVGCVLCCAVVCCCVLCCAFRRGVWLRCAVLSSLWLAVSFWSRCPVLCCASWCCVGPCRIVLCCVVLCCVVVRCAVRWGAASWCSVLCCPTVCCRGLLCAVWCQLALCGWLRVVLRCCLLRCAVLRLWAWCLVALCCAVLLLVNLCADADAFIFKLPCPLESFWITSGLRYFFWLLWLSIAWFHDIASNTDDVLPFWSNFWSNSKVVQSQYGNANGLHCLWTCGEMVVSHSRKRCLHRKKF